MQLCMFCSAVCKLSWVYSSVIRSYMYVSGECRSAGRSLPDTLMWRSALCTSPMTALSSLLRRPLSLLMRTPLVSLTSFMLGLPSQLLRPRSKINRESGWLLLVRYLEVIAALITTSATVISLELTVTLQNGQHCSLRPSSTHINTLSCVCSADRT